MLGVAGEADLQTALDELKKSAAGAITVKLEGGKPKVAVKPGASPKVSQAVTALNDLLAAMGKAVADLATVPKDAMALVQQAKALPAQVPSMVKSAGLKPTQIPKVARGVKNNIGALGSIPGEAKGVADQVTSSFKLIQQTFAG